MKIAEPYTRKGLERFLEQKYIPDSAINEAKNRIIEALKRGRMKLNKPSNEYEEMLENSTFYAELAMLELLQNPFVKNRTIIAEAKSRYEQIVINMEEDELIGFAEELGIRMKKEGASLFMRVEHYLEYAPESIDYSLFYKELHKGWVRINRHEAKRIIQEAIKKSIERIRIDKEAIERERFEEALAEIKEIIPKLSKKRIRVSIKNHPPCIERIMERLNNHKNLSHYERWVLAIYLIKINVGIEEINEMYKNLPDYNEKITKYQLKHIKEKEYKMPSCEKMRGYGLCVRECGTRNPMEWVYERKGKAVDKK